MALGFEKFIQEESWEVDPRNLQVGPSLLGTDQIVATLNDKWFAKIVLIAGVESLSAFRAWKTSRRGRLIVDQIGPKRELAGSADGKTLGFEVLHSDGTPHDDGVGYAQGYTVAAAVAVRATTMIVDDINGTGNFDAGRFFGVAGKLYQITSLNAPVGTQVNFNFWPPLRTAMVEEDGFDFPPRTDMRLATDADAPINDRIGEMFDVTINLVEVP